MPSKNLCHNLSVCSGFVNFATSKSGGSCRRRQGEMVEWSITPVLKTGIRRRIGGSNPSLSAINAENQQIAKQTPSFTPKNVKLGVFFFRIIFKLLIEYLVYNINLFIFAINSRWREKCLSLILIA